VRAISEEIAPSLAPGDLVVSTQPEQIPVLDYHLPDGLRYATLWGPVGDVGVTDWRDGVERLEATSARRDLAPLIDALPAGRRLVLVEPDTSNIERWKAPWTELVRVRSEEWRQHLSNDTRLTPVAVRPVEEARGVNQLRATVLLKG
jgi:mannosyltransferase